MGVGRVPGGNDWHALMAVILDAMTLIRTSSVPSYPDALAAHNVLVAPPVVCRHIVTSPCAWSPRTRAHSHSLGRTPGTRLPQHSHSHGRLCARAHHLSSLLFSISACTYPYTVEKTDAGLSETLPINKKSGPLCQDYPLSFSYEIAPRHLLRARALADRPSPAAKPRRKAFHGFVKTHLDARRIYPLGSTLSDNRSMHAGMNATRWSLPRSIDPFQGKQPSHPWPLTNPTLGRSSPAPLRHSTSSIVTWLSRYLGSSLPFSGRRHRKMEHLHTVLLKEEIPCPFSEPN